MKHLVQLALKITGFMIIFSGLAVGLAGGGIFPGMAKIIWVFVCCLVSCVVGLIFLGLSEMIALLRSITEENRESFAKFIEVVKNSNREQKILLAPVIKPLKTPGSKGTSTAGIIDNSPEPESVPCKEGNIGSDDFLQNFNEIKQRNKSMNSSLL